MTTRIKICGITRVQDVEPCARYGADAIGLVFYPPSPRFVSLERANEIIRATPPFLSVIGLFVNPNVKEVNKIIKNVPLCALQFHGDESSEFCGKFSLPYIKAARVKPGLDLPNYAKKYFTAQGILLDADTDGYGGGGKVFDWTLIPSRLPLPIILSGGLNADNVATAIRRIHPWAVDVSSGVESAKGIKDSAKIAAFIKEIKGTDHANV